MLTSAQTSQLGLGHYDLFCDLAGLRRFLRARPMQITEKVGFQVLLGPIHTVTISGATIPKEQVGLFDGRETVTVLLPGIIGTVQ